MSINNRALSARQVEKKTLFESIKEAATDSGTLSHQQIRALSKESLISQSSLLGTTSFYNFLRKANYNKKAYVCHGTCCKLSDKDQAAYSILAQQYSKTEIGEVSCLGHCYCAGAYWQGNNTYNITCGLNEHRDSDIIPSYHVASQLIFDKDIGDLNHFYHIALPDVTTIITELKHSRLRGRGGAGFLFVDKLISCAKALVNNNGEKYVVCNGDEGDPGAFSDRYLLEAQPHRVLAGMLAAGVTMGAKTGFIYIRAEYPFAVTEITKAIKAYENTSAYRQTGFHFRIITGAGSYVCGEETALLNSIEGLRPEVRTRPPYPAQEGLFGQPTLLSNVETFAAVPWIIQNSGYAFAAIGTSKSSGTKLISLDYGFNKPGVYEVDMGTPLEQLVYGLGGGFRHAVKALQIGGPLGCVVPLNKISALTLDFESFDEQGFVLGHAGIVTIPESYPIITFLRHLFTYMADESCGKCLPCRLGIEKGRKLLLDASKDNRIEPLLFHELLDTLEFGSLCGLGGGLPLPVRNILEYFSFELSNYFAER